MCFLGMYFRENYAMAQFEKAKAIWLTQFTYDHSGYEQTTLESFMCENTGFIHFIVVDWMLLISFFFLTSCQALFGSRVETYMSASHHN